jgi:hypothetical protein
MMLPLKSIQGGAHQLSKRVACLYIAPGYKGPHSQCSLRKNPKFLQNIKPKNNTLGEDF